MHMIHPVIIRGVEIPSNIFFAPINPGRSSHGLISDAYVDFFVQHAGRGIGVCYVGNVALQEEWASNDGTAILFATPDTYWIKLSGLIATSGSLPGIQLAWKPAHITLQRDFITSDYAEQIKLFKEFYNSFKDIDSVANQFIKSINYAAALGFSVVQIHAAHGYALSLLLSRTISGCNTPEETKGIELIRKIVAGLGKHSAIFDIRLSLYEGINDGLSELEYKTRLVELLLECGFDIISLSNGFYNIDKTMIYPPKKNKPVILREAENFAEKYPDVLWNVAGNIEIALMEKTNVPCNLTFSLGRQLLADPNTVMKIKQHAYGDIYLCSECNACHYYSYGFDGIRQCKTTEHEELLNR